MIHQEFSKDIDLSVAIRAFNGTSFSPERRGQSVINDWKKYMAEDSEEIKKIAGDDWQEEFERYHKKAKELYLNWLHSRSNVMSAMITGPARFPTARNEKRWGWADNHWNKFAGFRAKAKKGIKKKYKKQIDPLVAARINLETRQKNQERMKAVNKIIRSKKLAEVEKREQISEIGFSESSITNLLTPDYAGRVGFPAYALSNNNANIKRLKSRVSLLEAKQQKAESNEPSKEVYQCDEFKIIANFEADRYQVLFEEKPDYDTRKILKSNGFRWSPNNMAWQRHLTPNSRYAIDRMLKHDFKLI